jgi:hypothetical protein
MWSGAQCGGDKHTDCQVSNGLLLQAEHAQTAGGVQPRAHGAPATAHGARSNTGKGEYCAQGQNNYLQLLIYLLKDTVRINRVFPFN